MLQPTNSETMETRLCHIRKFEILALRPWFKPGSNVLEIGGGFGYQASIIASWGCKIISLDVNPKSSYFPIQHYDGVSIPFGDGSFDIVFSSNTLEHVNQLNALTAETRRVMRADGVGIHSLPSPIWRFWSNLGHYINLSRKLMSGEYGASYALRRELIPRRHGEKGNALSELHYFSRSYWKHIFEENGFKVIRIEPDRLFYTSPALFPNASLKLGVTSAKLFGSSCNTFFLKRKND